MTDLESAVREYHACTLAGEDRLRARVAQLERELAEMRYRYACACERIESDEAARMAWEGCPHGD